MGWSNWFRFSLGGLRLPSLHVHGLSTQHSPLKQHDDGPPLPSRMGRADGPQAGAVLVVLVCLWSFLCGVDGVPDWFEWPTGARCLLPVLHATPTPTPRQAVAQSRSSAAHLHLHLHLHWRRRLHLFGNLRSRGSTACTSHWLASGSEQGRWRLSSVWSSDGPLLSWLRSQIHLHLHVHGQGHGPCPACPPPSSSDQGPPQRDYGTRSLLAALWPRSASWSTAPARTQSPVPVSLTRDQRHHTSRTTAAGPTTPSSPQHQLTSHTRASVCLEHGVPCS